MTFDGTILCHHQHQAIAKQLSQTLGNISKFGKCFHRKAFVIITNHFTSILQILIKLTFILLQTLYGMLINYAMGRGELVSNGDLFYLSLVGRAWTYVWC